MNIVEKEAKEFSREFYNSGDRITLENLTSSLTSKYFMFKRERDQLDFLKILRQNSLLEKENHLKECNQKGCKFPEDRDLGVFAIDQEIDEINSYFKFEPNKDDAFTPEEESNLHSKLNEVIEHLSTLKVGQEVIFEEIESLKNHFNLGKKTWFQLLKGKLGEVMIEQALEKTVVQEIFSKLSEGFKASKHFLNS